MVACCMYLPTLFAQAGCDTRSILGEFEIIVFLLLNWLPN